MLQPSYAVAPFTVALKILYWRYTYKIIYQCTVLVCFFLPFDSGEVSTVFNQSFSVAIMFELRTRIKTDCTDRPSYFDIEVWLYRQWKGVLPTTNNPPIAIFDWSQLDIRARLYRYRSSERFCPIVILRSLRINLSIKKLGFLFFVLSIKLFECSLVNTYTYISSGM